MGCRQHHRQKNGNGAKDHDQRKFISAILYPVARLETAQQLLLTHFEEKRRAAGREGILRPPRPP